MNKYVLAVDQGTTSCRAIVFNHGGEIISSSQKEFTQIYPTPGCVEHDPLEIWGTQIGVIIEAVQKAGISFEDICALGITNQRETTVVWDKYTGKPIYNAIVWQCRRTSEMVDGLKEKGLEAYIKDRTGLIPDAYFSGTKIAWILNNVPGAREAAKAGDLLFGTVDTWIIWNLTKGKAHVTDYSNASRTMLYDIKKLAWDEKILAELNIPVQMLPEVKPSSCVYGYADKSLLGEELPIAGAAGDQQAALFGQCCFDKGEVKNTYGTGCFLLMNTGNEAITSKYGLLTTIAASTSSEVQYALEGSVFVAGAAIQWLRDELQLIRSAAESEKYAMQVADTNGVYVVPAFAGLGAPYWDQYARGTIVGITRGANRDHIIRATLESIAYQTFEVLKAMEFDTEIILPSLKVDGGASANRFLMQFQADILNTKVLKPQVIETTALGAAYLAGLAVGFWKDKDEIRSNWALAETFVPNMASERREELMIGWHKAVKRSFEWEE